jgi:hypothetical protein
MYFFRSKQPDSKQIKSYLPEDFDACQKHNQPGIIYFHVIHDYSHFLKMIFTELQLLKLPNQRCGISEGKIGSEREAGLVTQKALLDDRKSQILKEFTEGPERWLYQILFLNSVRQHSFRVCLYFF